MAVHEYAPYGGIALACGGPFISRRAVALLKHRNQSGYCFIGMLSFIADRQAKLGDDRVVRKMSHSVIDARFVSERSPYMRTER
jgi:hypothetical protein